MRTSEIELCRYLVDLAKKCHPLPVSQNQNGRPVWEQPLFDYLRWIGDEYDKTRKAVMKWTGGDVMKPTEYLILMRSAIFGRSI